jgi:hypothetical protein
MTIRFCQVYRQRLIRALPKSYCSDQAPPSVILSAAKNQPPMFGSLLYSTQSPPLVILSAAKNLVLHRDVTPFLRASTGEKKGGIWVLKDEILRCAQNDRGGLWFRTPSTLQTGPSLRRRLGYLPARGFSHRASPQGIKQAVILRLHPAEQPIFSPPGMSAPSLQPGKNKRSRVLACWTRLL